MLTRSRNGPKWSGARRLLDHLVKRSEFGSIKGWIYSELAVWPVGVGKKSRSQSQNFLKSIAIPIVKFWESIPSKIWDWDWDPSVDPWWAVLDRQWKNWLPKPILLRLIKLAFYRVKLLKWSDTVDCLKHQPFRKCPLS